MILSYTLITHVAATNKETDDVTN